MQIASIYSLLATQKNYKYEVWLWLDENTKELNTDNNKWIQAIKDKIKILYYSAEQMTQERVFGKSSFLLKETDILAYRADTFRIWALKKYGGLYFDLDIMFLKSIRPLLVGPEFVYSWEKQPYANNAIIYFRKDSWINNYVFEKAIKRHTTQPWVLFEYADQKLRPLYIYNSSLYDPLWEEDDEVYPIHAFDEFFTKSVMDEDAVDPFPYSYAYHWHNNWKSEINDKSLFARLEKKNCEVVKDL